MDVAVNFLALLHTNEVDQSAFEVKLTSWSRMYL